MTSPPDPAMITNAAPGRSSRRSPRASRRRSMTLLVNVGLFSAGFFAFASHELGATIHSLVGIAFLGIIAWHVTSQRRWVRSAMRRRLAHPERTLVAYNGVFASTFLIATLSGLPVWFWNAGGLILQLHTVTGIAFLPLILGHLVLNRRRLAAKLRRDPSRPAAA